MPLYNGNYVAPIWVNGVPPTVGETELDLISGVLQDSQTLKLNGAPTTLTRGVVGQFCADMSTATPTLYRCYEVSNAGYIWRLAGDFEENLTQEYDSTATYAEGDYCTYDGDLYRALVDITTAEEWTAAHWTQVKAANEVENHVTDTANPHEVTAAQVGLGNLTNDKQYSADNPAVKLGTVSLSSSWSGSGGIYTQTVTVTGATVTANSHVELQFTSAQAEALADAGIPQIVVENNGGILTATAFGGNPGAMTVQCTVEELNFPPSLEFRGNDSFTLYTSGLRKIWDGTMEYSTNGQEWSVWDGTTTLTSGAENSIYLRGTGNPYVSANPSHLGLLERGFYFGGNAREIECNGDIETIRDYQAVERNEAVETPANFKCLFRQCTALKSAPKLTALSVAPSGYYDMFYQCESLVNSPEILATTLAAYSFTTMFEGCTSLEYPPSVLPATTLNSWCYSGMFRGCTSLKLPPSIRATTTAEYCCAGMFYGCISLEALPELLSVNLEFECYASMFYGCSAVKVSQTQDSTYTTPYRIPKEGTSSSGERYETYQMITGTGGSFTGSPVINTTYYTSNGVIPAT